MSCTVPTDQRFSVKLKEGIFRKKNNVHVLKRQISSDNKALFISPE